MLIIGGGGLGGDGVRAGAGGVVATSSGVVAVVVGAGRATTLGAGGGCAVQLEAAAKADKSARGMAAKRRCSIMANPGSNRMIRDRRHVRHGTRHRVESFRIRGGCLQNLDRVMQTSMTDEQVPSGRRVLPVVQSAPRNVVTRYSPDVLQGIALGEAAALAPVVAQSVAGAIEAAETATSRAEQLVARAMQHEPPEQAMACSRGCSTCCQAKVIVVAPEILRLGEYLRQTKSPEELSSILEKVRLADAVTRGLSREARAEAHVPCPLLDADGACSVHDVRPLVCRSWTSYDAEACRTYWHAPLGQPTPPQWPVGYELAQAVLAGLGKACLDGGFDGLPLEFIAALRIAIERPNAGERWHKRLPVFMGARDAEWAQKYGQA